MLDNDSLTPWFFGATSASASCSTEKSPFDPVTPQTARVSPFLSRPFVVRLIDEGKIPSRRVGMHRWRLFRD
jgi:hypothetical protein